MYGCKYKFCTAAITLMACISLPANVRAACIPASTTTCLAFCESEAALSTSASTTKTTLQEQIDLTKEKIDLKIKDTDNSNTQAITAAATSATNDTSFLTKSVAGIYDASNQHDLTLMKSKEAFVTARDMKPTIAECVAITSRRGVLEGRAIQNAAFKSMNREESDTFQHVEGVRDADGNPRPYSQGAAIRRIYDDWRTKYCSESSNNGTAGNVPGGCGESRSGDDDNYKINLDLHVADILFNSDTYPEEDIVDAKKTIAFYFGAKPLPPIAPRDYDNPSTQGSVVKMRQLAAKKNLADSVFDYLASKRLPSISSATTKEILTKDIAETSPFYTETIGKIGDQVSFSQWMDVFMSKRFMGTDYFTRVAEMNDSQSAREITELMSYRIVQQRERYLMLERLLALVAADYASDVNTSSQGTTLAKSR